MTHIPLRRSVIAALPAIAAFGVLALSGCTSGQADSAGPPSLGPTVTPTAAPAGAAALAERYHRAGGAERYTASRTTPAPVPLTSLSGPTTRMMATKRSPPSERVSLLSSCVRKEFRWPEVIKSTYSGPQELCCIASTLDHDLRQCEGVLPAPSGLTGQKPL